jgi:predicted ATP-grasp superfamily ATP-dependent carboligase
MGAKKKKGDGPKKGGKGKGEEEEDRSTENFYKFYRKKCTTELQIDQCKQIKKLKEDFEEN